MWQDLCHNLLKGSEWESCGSLLPNFDELRLCAEAGLPRTIISVLFLVVTREKPRGQ